MSKKGTKTSDFSELFTKSYYLKEEELIQGVFLFFNWDPPKNHKYGKKLKFLNWDPPKNHKYGQNPQKGPLKETHFRTVEILKIKQILTNCQDSLYEIFTARLFFVASVWVFSGPVWVVQCTIKILLRQISND